MHTISKVDSDWSHLSGAKAICSTQGLFHEIEISSHPSIEHALLVIGAKLAREVNAIDSIKRKFNEFTIRHNNTITKNIKP